MLTGQKYLLEERKLTEETIQAFHLGYCDYFGQIYADTKFPAIDFKFEKYEIPKFRNTVLFPICNMYGKMVGISARALDKDADNKYMNTVYQKTDHLYGLNLTWPHILKAKKVYVVEGNVDTAMLYQAGIKNVVGILSSVLKLKQICLLSRFVEDIVMIPDADDAGRKIIDRVKKTLKENRIEVRFYLLTLPESYDPDKYVKEFGKDKLLKLNTSLFYDKGVLCG